MAANIFYFNQRWTKCRKEDKTNGGESSFQYILSCTDLVKEFDAVVVASGHYHACRVPDIPGLKEWKTTWPSKVLHSKSYRVPDLFKDQAYLPIFIYISQS